MSYFPCDIPYMSKEELEENGIKIPKDKGQEPPDIIKCKDCTHYHKNVWAKELGVDKKFGNIIVAHHGCDRWTKDMNCVTPNGFCFLAERGTDETDL